MREFVGSFKEFISDPQVANLPLETAKKWYDTYTRLPSISEKLYNELHTSELVKTNIKINVSEFKKEIKFYENKFTKWGKKYPKVPRFGIPMVNLTGSLDEDDDPSRQPLDEYFFNLQKVLHDAEIKTNIKIDVNQFKKEIKFYENKFTKWGKKYPKIPRFGIPMVNTTGSLDEDDDPSRQPLDEYLFNSHKVLHDAEIKTKTEVCNMKTLEPLKILYSYLIRSSILKWDKGGFFAPHCDVYVPAPNLRIWGTTSNNIELIIDKKVQKDIEPGRIYIIDTAKEHEAKSFEDEVYQFFIGLSIDSYDTLKKIKC